MYLPELTDQQERDSDQPLNRKTISPYAFLSDCTRPLHSISHRGHAFLHVQAPSLRASAMTTILEEETLPDVDFSQLLDLDNALTGDVEGLDSDTWAVEASRDPCPLSTNNEYVHFSVSRASDGFPTDCTLASSAMASMATLGFPKPPSRLQQASRSLTIPSSRTGSRASHAQRSHATTVDPKGWSAICNAAKLTAPHVSRYSVNVV